MSRKTKYQPSPGQLSLEDLPGFWSKGTNQESTASQLLPEKSPGFAKEAATKYQVTPKTLDSLVETFHVPQLNQIPIYVGLTFDPCQGIREVKQRWKQNPVSSEVVFDCRPLELAPKYATEPKLDELFAPEEEYLLRRGGYLNNAVFMNVLRCYGTLAKWSQDVYEETGIQPIQKFNFMRPKSNTPVGKLWDVLEMPELIKKNPQNVRTSSGELEFQSRIVTPFLLVESSNRNDVLRDVQDWLHDISNRIGNKTPYRLFKLISEVVKNLVEHGQRGTFGVSIWPSGQIEILWSNRIDHLVDWWSPEDNAKSLAKSLLSTKGAGMPYIYEDLLPTYKGVLIVNWKTHNLIFRSAGDFSIMGLHPRSDSYLPRSILFHLHLFCPETRNRSSSNASH